MSLKHTPAGNLQSIAPSFKLIGTDEKYYSLNSCQGEKGTLVMFICNHCPYVIAVRERLVDVANKLLPCGVNTIAIMANDPTDYPEDSFENMKKVAAEFNFSFPYLLDDSQEIAKAYGAVCTPDFFGYNRDLKLQYRGRLDEGHIEPPKKDAKRELLDAMKLVSATGKGPKEQIPSMGCSIKWHSKN
jgi:peroxiredoxin